MRTAIAGARRFDVDVVALNMGFQPEVNLARALGVPHRFVDRGAGYLATETDAEGRTSVAGVFAVGDGAVLGGARIAQARGRLAGLAAAREIGLAAPPDRAATAALARAETLPGRAVAPVTPHPPCRSQTTRSSAAARRSPPRVCAPKSPAAWRRCPR